MTAEAEPIAMEGEKRAVTTAAPVEDGPPPPRRRGRIARALRTIFVVVLLLGLAYAVRKGALSWK